MFVYVMAQRARGETRGDYYIKIGISGDPVLRRATLQTGNPNPIDLIETFPVSGRRKAEEVEASAHHALKDCALGGEWFLGDVWEAVKAVGALV